MAAHSRLLHLAAFLLAIPLASAEQTPQPPTTDPLTVLLTHLEDNINDFKRSVPSFFCDERTISEIVSGSSIGSERTVTDAHFRIRRAEDPKDADDLIDTRDNITRDNALQESRVVTAINGRSIAPDKASNEAPFSVFGLFSGGINRVSAGATVCFTYQLHPARPNHKNDRIEIDFDTLPREKLTDCPYKEKATGRAFIDPTSLQVIRLENITKDSDGTWKWSIDYAPVTLGGKIFNLPTSITSTQTTQVQTHGTPSLRLPSTSEVSYRLISRYTNYHLRTVTSKILLP